MAVILDSVPIVSDQASPRTRLSREPGRAVVWLEGEHDIASDLLVAEALARAIGPGDTDLIVDLSEVGFIGASTIAMLRRARAFLLDRNHTLVVRAPGRSACRIIEILEAGVLFDTTEETQVASRAVQPARAAIG